MYDSDEEKSDVSTSQKYETKYSQINTTETQDDNMRFSGDAEDLSCDEDFSLQYFPRFYRQLGVVKYPRKTRATAQQSSYEQQFTKRGDRVRDRLYNGSVGMILGTLIFVNSLCLLIGCRYQRDLTNYPHQVPELVQDSIKFNRTIYIVNSSLYAVAFLLGYAPDSILKVSVWL